MKILLFSNLFPNPIEPERGIFVKQLADGFRGKASLTVVTPLPYCPDIGVLKRIERWNRLSRVPYRFLMGDHDVYSPKYPVIPGISEHIHPYLMFVGVFPTIRRLHEEKGFDLINAQWLYPDGVAAAWLGSILRIPVVLTGHGSDIHRDLNDPRKKRKISKAAERAAAVIVVSNALSGKLIEHGIGNGKVQVIPNGINVVRFAVKDRYEIRKRMGMDGRSQHVLFVGRLMEVKGIPFLIEAVKILSHSSRAKLILHIVGDGPLRPVLEDHVLAAGIQDQIIFEGHKSHDDVADWMGAADVLCLPSLEEGCPNVVLESLASGTPVVASEVGGIPDLLDPESGILVPPGDPESLARALSESLERPWNRNAISSKVAGMTWESIARKYLELFEESLFRGNRI